MVTVSFARSKNYCRPGMRNNPISVESASSISGYVSEYKYQHEVKEMTLHEQAEYLAFNVHNKIQKNGRINLGMDSNGQLISNSVSPLADGFIRNVEPKIKNIVSALHEKRYLTYSSCQGHTYENRRYVGLAFGDKSSRDAFKGAIDELELYGVKVSYKDTVYNLNSSVIPGINAKVEVHKVDGLEERERKYTNSEAEAFNIIFKRKYAKYYFAELLIYGVKPKFCWIRFPIRSLKFLFLKMFKWDATTTKVMEHIKDPKFPKYRL
jgi:hypothetical protein